MHNIMIWKNNIVFGLFCLLEITVGWFRDSKPPLTYNAGDSQRWLGCRQIQSIALLLLLLWLPGGVQAASCNSVATGNWGTSGTWSCSQVPATGDSVTILNGHTITMNANTSALASLTVNSGGALTTSGKSGSDLYLQGNLVNNGTINMQASSGTNTIYLAGTSVTSTFSGTGSWLLDNLDLNGQSPACTGACKVEISGSPNLQFINSNLFSGNSSTFTFNALQNSTATVSLVSSGTQTLATTGVTFPNLMLSGGGTKRPSSGTVTILGNFTISSGDTYDGTTNDPVVNVGGNLLNAGTFTASNTAALNVTGSFTNTSQFTGSGGAANITGSFINSGTFSSGNGSYTLKGGIMQNGGTFTAGTGVFIFSTNDQGISCASSLTIPSITVTTINVTNNCNLTVTTALAGTGILTNAATLNINGTSSITTLTNAGTATITGSGAITTATLTNTGTLNLNGTNAITAITNSTNGILNISSTAAITTLTASTNPNTVNYTGAAQTVNATTYHDLGLSGSGAKTFTSATINGDLNLSGSATATLTGVSTITGNVTTSGTATATTASNLSIGGNLTIGTGTTFTSANVNSVVGTTSVTGTLAHSGAAAKTYIGAVTINANGAWTNAGNAPVTFQGGLTHNGTTFTAGTGLYTFGTNSQAIGGSSAIAIPSVTVTGVTLTNNSTLTVATALAGSGGLTNSASGTLNIGGPSAITTLTASASGNVVNYTGAAAQTINATSYDTLNTSGTGVKTVDAATVVTVNTALTGTALTNAGTLNIGGTSAITTLTAIASGNIVNYTGTGQTVKATAYDTLNVSVTSTNSGTVTAAAVLGGSGTLTNSATGTLNIGGTSTITGLTATASGNVVNYTGTGQTVKATAYDTLNVTNTASNSGTVTVATALGGAGTLTNGATGTLNINGTSGITTLTATAVGNIVNYTGAAQTVKATTYHHLGLSGSGAKTFTSATINGDLNLSGSVTATLTNVTTITGNVNTSNTATATTAANLSIGGNLTIGTGTTFTSANFTNSVAGTTSVTGTLAHSGAATKTYTGTVTINNGGAWTNAGNAPVNFGGGFNQSGTFTSGSGIYNFNGSSAQSITGTPTFQNLAVSSSGGVTLSTGSVTVSTLLTLTSGTVTTGANTLIASGANCTTSISRTSGFVIGNLQLTVPVTNPVTCSYPVGDSIGYAPISITKTGTNTGTLIGRTDNGDHPDGSSTIGIDQTKNANHYWTLTAGTLASGTTYTATFQFCATGTCVVPTEVDSGAVTSNFIVTEKGASTWSSKTVGTKTTTSTQATGLTGFGVFEVGEQGGGINCTSLATGNWNSTATWTNCRGNVPLAADTVTIASGHSVTLDTTTPAISSLTITGTLTASATNTLTLGGNLTNNGTLSLGTSGSVTLTAASQWTGTGATWTLKNLTLGSQALSFNATDTFTLGINGSISGLGTINSAATNTNITFDFSSISAQTMAATGVTYPNLTVSGGNTKTPASGVLDIRGNFSVATSTTFAGDSNNPTVTLKGNFSNSGIFNAGTSVWTLNGTSAQTITGTPSFSSLTINNSTGITLSSNVTVSTALALTSGNVTTGSNLLIYSNANCSASPITRSTGFVNGNLRLTFPTGTTTCTYPVGSGNTYAPIGMNLTGGGSLTGSTTGNEHPQAASSGIDTTLDANRYWSLWASGDTVNASSYSPTFNFVAGDADALATPTNFVVGKYTGAVWSLLAPTSALATLTAVTIAAGITAPTDFISGETAFTCSVPSGSPTGTTCVCDNFARTTLNPSTIYNGNWHVSSSSGGFSPQIVNKRLRLTSNSGTESTAATGPGTFPAAGNWVTAEFKHYAYGGGTGTAGSGADGIALTLSDSTITAVPGAFGGSLGYAQKSNPGSDCATIGGCPGFAGGWIGIAIDEYGNFSANTEGRTGNASPAPQAPGRTIESVAVRGSGSGQTGYPYLGGTSTLTTNSIDNYLTNAADGYGYAYRLTVDARNYTTGSKTALVKVERDITGTGNSYTTLIPSFDAYVANPSQAAVPTNWQLSYTGSTGGSANIHEITGMKVCAQTYTPPAGYRILVDNFSPTTCATDPQPTVTISALNSNSNIITSYANTVNLSATLLGGGSSSAIWTSQGTNHGTFDSVNKRYTFVAADNGVAKFTLSDTIQQNVYITISEYPGTLNSSLGTPVQYSSGVASFVVDIPLPPAETLGSGVVAGRAHLLRITRNTSICGGGPDNSYTGSKLMDGWYNQALPDHPTGAAAPQICPPVSGLCQPSYVTNSCQPLSIAAPALSQSSNNLSLSFSNGVANFCLVTTDVGKYTIDLRDDTTAPAAPVYGSSITLTARPFAVVVSDLYQSATANPGSDTPSGDVFAKAGSSFQAKVGGYLWDTAGDANGDGLPNDGATFAQTIGSGITPHYADTVTLSAITPYAPATGTKGSLSNGSVSVTGGSTTVSTLSYPEVGSFTLAAIPLANYLNSGVDLSTRVAIFSQPGNTFQSALVGRFIPDHFLLSSPAVTPACGTFSYFGQDGFTTAFTLTAVNVNDTQTNNYVGDGSSSSSWAKLPLTAWTGFSFAASSWSPSQPSGTALAASATPPTAANWVSGSTTVTAFHYITRPTSPAAPTTVNITALPVDSDGVTMPSAATLATAMPLRYGRINLQNAYGSELLDLPMSLTAEYWNGSSWVTNSSDQCTTGITLSEAVVTGPITTLCAWDTVTPGSSGLGCSVAGTSANQFSQLSPSSLVKGNFNLNFHSPGTGNTGVIDITATVPDYLKFNWRGTGDTNPTARATFGIYKGNSKFIYIRELY